MADTRTLVTTSSIRQWYSCCLNVLTKKTTMDGKNDKSVKNDKSGKKAGKGKGSKEGKKAGQGESKGDGYPFNNNEWPCGGKAGKACSRGNFSHRCTRCGGWDHGAWQTRKCPMSQSTGGGDASAAAGKEEQ